MGERYVPVALSTPRQFALALCFQ